MVLKHYKTCQAVTEQSNKASHVCAPEAVLQFQNMSVLCVCVCVCAYVGEEEQEGTRENERVWGTQSARALLKLMIDTLD